jgi:hypothetical protein
MEAVLAPYLQSIIVVRPEMQDIPYDPGNPTAENTFF